MNRTTGDSAMPRPARLLGSERFARWTADGRLAALVATAPPVEDAPPPIEVVEVPPTTPPADRTPVDQTFAPPEGGIPFTIPAVVLEGWNTTDGGTDVRYIEPGSLGRLDMPQTIMAMIRNPDGGFSGHDAAIAAGRIDTMERFDASAMINRETGEPFGEGVWGWRATGFLVPHDDQPGSAVTADYVRDQVLRGVSADLREVDGEVDVLELDEDGYPERVRMRVTQGVIGQCTITPAGAFPSAYIILDEGQGTDATAPPSTEAVPVEPAGLRVITSSGRRRRALVAAGGIAPAQPPREWFQRVEQLNPSRHVYLGRRADGTPTGQVWGYLAQFGVPHAGILDREVLAPRLGPNGYRTFTSQGVVYTAEGEEVPTGILTFGGGHANENLGVIPALAHYDNAGTAYADVTVGEDEFGVWFAGAMRPELSRDQVETFGRHPLSGDWRANEGDDQVRLVAALSVNTPGFPIGARSHIAASGVRSLVAAGSAPLTRRAQRAGHEGDPDAVRRVVDERMRPVLQAAARAGLARLRPPR
jgi:hypothetical protein